LLSILAVYYYTSSEEANIMKRITIVIASAVLMAGQVGAWTPPWRNRAADTQSNIQSPIHPEQKKRINRAETIIVEAKKRGDIQTQYGAVQAIATVDRRTPVSAITGAAAAIAVREMMPEILGAQSNILPNPLLPIEPSNVAALAGYRSHLNTIPIDQRPTILARLLNMVQTVRFYREKFPGYGSLITSSLIWIAANTFRLPTIVTQCKELIKAELGRLAEGGGPFMYDAIIIALTAPYYLEDEGSVLEILLHVAQIPQLHEMLPDVIQQIRATCSFVDSRNFDDILKHLAQAQQGMQPNNLNGMGEVPIPTGLPPIDQYGTGGVPMQQGMQPMDQSGYPAQYGP
jgi:hypothetical protein